MTRARRWPKDRMGEGPLPDALAYFMTWSTYGTWLPGDERGWSWHGRGWQLPDPIRELEARAIMTEDACRFDAAQRKLVEQTIRDHCKIRRWELHEVNCRTNHLHLVVSAPRHPDVIREQFKAWCTRRLKTHQADCYPLTAASPPPTIRTNWWSERGSCRWIDSQQSLEAAITYVRDGQDKQRFRNG